MTESPVVEIQIVEVTTDGLGRDLPKKQLWAVSASPSDAETLVLAAVPEGWTAELFEHGLTPEQAALLELAPGDVRQL
jgi:hypothetical protein